MKYELVDYNEDTKLYRIKALIGFGDVKAGDLGGWVSGEYNLSQEGNCWIYEDAKVSGRAQVFGDAKVSGRARVAGNAEVYGNARVYGEACIHDNAKVYGKAMIHTYVRVCGNAVVTGDAHVHGEAEVYDNARVHRDARIGGYARVCGNAEVSGHCLYISANPHAMTITDNHVRIGGEQHSIEHWLDNYKDIGIINEFTIDEMKMYKYLLKAIKKIREI